MDVGQHLYLLKEILRHDKSVSLDLKLSILTQIKGYEIDLANTFNEAFIGTKKYD